MKTWQRIVFEVITSVGALLMTSGTARAGTACYLTYARVCETSGGTLWPCLIDAGPGNRFCYDEDVLDGGVFCSAFVTYGMDCDAAWNGLIGEGYVCTGTTSSCAANCAGGCGGW